MRKRANKRKITQNTFFEIENLGGKAQPFGRAGRKHGVLSRVGFTPLCMKNFVGVVFILELTRQVVNSVGIRTLLRILGSVPATEAAAIYLAGCLNSLTNSNVQ